MGLIKVLLVGLWVVFGFSSAGAQSQEAQQLALNVEKLSQLKNILSDMKRGYEIISKGYNSVKNIAQGNFSLHDVFLDGLWLISPEVRRYPKIAGIISYQKDLVVEYKAALRRFSRSDVFAAGELDYLGKVYKNLLDNSLDNLDQLAMVVTARKLRMSDAERLEAIDRIYLRMEDQLGFLRSFNERTAVLGAQREREKLDVIGLGSYYRGN